VRWRIATARAILDFVTPDLRGPLALALAAVTLLVLGVAAPAGAQGPATGFTPQEAQAYKAWYDANGASDVPKAIGLAREYLTAYPAGRYADYLRSWLPQVRSRLFGQAVLGRDADGMLLLGRVGHGDNTAEHLILS